jgi:hypothetical protein
MIIVTHVSAIATIIRQNPYKYVQRKANTVYLPLYIFIEILPDDGCSVWNM